MSYSSRSISAEQQNTIISNANIAVARFAKSYADKLGLKRFFTKEDLEDIAGNTIYKACRSFDCFDPSKAKLSTWVSRIAINCVISAVEYKAKRLPISNALYDENSENGDEFSADEFCDSRKGFNPEVWGLLSEYEADKEINRKEFEYSVRKEVSKLSEKNQRFERMLEEGDAPRDMALAEGCSADAAAKRVWVIRQTLREPLSEIADEFGISRRKVAC